MNSAVMNRPSPMAVAVGASIASSLIPVANFSAVAIVYKASEPSKLFLELKFGHPIALIDRTLNPIGGNWVGKDALNDNSPLDTLTREIGEEISFVRPIRNADELDFLDVATNKTWQPTPMDATPTDEDVAMQEEVKRAIISAAHYYCATINTVSKEAMDVADPKNERQGFSSLAVYFECGLSDETWAKLEALQKKFGNLSAEALTVMTSKTDIILDDAKVAFGHDAALADFLKAKGHNVEGFPTVHGVSTRFIGTTSDVELFSSYAEMLTHFNPTKRP